MKKGYVATTDGGCITYVGVGAWACIVTGPDGVDRIYSGCRRGTTNNQMEFEAVIAALEHTPKDASLVIRSDSQYVLNAATVWGDKWKRFGWRFSVNGQKPIKNLDLVKKVHALKQGRKIDWQWVRGHNGDPLNEKCDAICGRLMNSLLARR